ncbi:YhgE/Pip family protein [Alicyclobacillus dauci]|uniref:YhgE/Pip domain-containing protein n=1 Tax=Alicyclobacillus dauci TaxID=1475485 RepID=A0ABY6Z2Z4_9BACL|nr:YhgE/Pip domain-containing protein [Alicyclobacillus dauci]WAH37264.1 YhgE/Pip domain-containing protein [Alicyclobacillus dauci]
MNPFATVGREFRFNFGDLKRAIPIFAIFLIPILYAGTFLWAFWDPYGHLDRMPVAVVNEDQGASLNGHQVQAGQQLEDRLRSDNSLDWHFVSQSEAQKGLADNQYYMVITIPNDFSSEAAKAATTIGAPQPHLMSVTNDRHNYISGIIGRNAMESLQEKTAQELTKTYTTNLVSGLQQMETGLKSAKTGADQVASGANSLTANSGQLVQGAQKLAEGSQSIGTALQQANTGANQVANGAKSAYQGTQQLKGGLDQLTTAATQLQQGSTQLQGGASKLTSGLQSESAGAKQTASGASQVADGLAAYAKAHPELANDPQFQALVQSSGQVAQGSSQVAAASNQLLQGATQVNDGATKLSTGLNQFVPQLSKVRDGAAAMTSKEPALVTGSQQLAQGLAQLQSGASTLQFGAGTLATGVTQYTAGASKLAGGASTLANHLNSATNSLPTVNKSQLVSANSNPVGVTEQKTGGINNYGNGFAPYFLSLGLFVGALLMSIVIAFRDPPAKPQSGFAWFLSKTLLISMVGLVQALIADAILLFGLGVHTNSIGHFILFSCLASMTFVSIVQLFVTTMANPGRYLAVILLILQLTTSSGTYPVILSPRFFQSLNPYLPMTYSVDGFRYLVGGGEVSFMSSDIWHLFLYWGVFMALTIVYFLIRYRLDYGRKDAHGAPSQAALQA